MLGLIGVLGALVAGVVADALMSMGGKDDDDDPAVDTPETRPEGADLLADDDSLPATNITERAAAGGTHDPAEDVPLPQDDMSGETVIGTDADEFILGTAADDWLAGAGGADTVDGSVNAIDRTRRTASLARRTGGPLLARPQLDQVVCNRIAPDRKLLIVAGRFRRQEHRLPDRGLLRWQLVGIHERGSRLKGQRFAGAID